MKTLAVLALLVALVHAYTKYDKPCHYYDLCHRESSTCSSVHYYSNHIVAWYNGWMGLSTHPWKQAVSSLEKGVGYYEVHYAYNKNTGTGMQFKQLMDAAAPAYYYRTLKVPPAGSHIGIRIINMSDIPEIKRLIEEGFAFNGMTTGESMRELEQYAKRLVC